jgi:3-hydroxyacyl-[acyl-carrier-protein] dehydratase
MSKIPTIIDIKEIIRLLPHRYPFLLIDKIIAVEPRKSAIAIKNVTFNEPHFTGHFPNNPIMPGVLIVEAMAQTAIAMVMKGDSDDIKNKLVYFMSINDAKFRKPVVPGDVLELHVNVIQNRGSVWKMAANAIVEGEKVAEANFSAIMVDKPNIANQDN